MIDKEKKKLNMKVQWTKFAVVTLLYLIFLYWLESWLGLIVVPFIFDVYITKKIRWQWWKDSERPVRFIMSWVDALVFALVAVYFINLFFFQNYVIPSSSLEKSLLTGDYLFVSKVSYGPRIPQTPLTMPLTQHTLPVFGCKSYIEWPQWDYRRAKGLGKVELNDIVVFNYPAGDTLVSSPQYQAADYYQMCYSYGSQLIMDHPDMSKLTPQQQRDWYNRVYNIGRNYILDNHPEFGSIISRPVDRRENYVKRCVGLPGQTLQIKDRIVYLDGKPNKEPDNVQYTYNVKLNQPLPDDLMHELGISMEDLTSLNQNGYMPLTKKAATALAKRRDLAAEPRITAARIATSPTLIFRTKPMTMTRIRTSRDINAILFIDTNPFFQFRLFLNGHIRSWAVRWGEFPFSHGKLINRPDYKAINVPIERYARKIPPKLFVQQNAFSLFV